MKTYFCSISRLPVFLANMLVAGIMVASAPTWAGDQCIRGTLNAEVDLLSPYGPAVGTAIAMIGDQVLPIQAFGVIVSSKVTEGGNIHLVVEENDSTPDGSTIQIRDNIKLTPTEAPGEYDMDINSKILGGTGIFYDVDGKYQGSGHASFNTGHLSHTGEAKICGLAGF